MVGQSNGAGFTTSRLSDRLQKIAGPIATVLSDHQAMTDATIIVATLTEIEVPSRLRQLDEAAVTRLMESIDQLGLRHPITVVDRNGKLVLVAGLHRLEAARRLGHATIHAALMPEDTDERSCRLWEVAENLHRGDLSLGQRSDQIALWVALRSEKPGQLPTFRTEPVAGGRGNEGGVALTARELGIERTEVRRALAIAAIPSHVRSAADEAGLTTQTARLEIAKAADPMAKLDELTLRRGKKPVQSLDPVEDEMVRSAGGRRAYDRQIRTEEAQLAALVAAWNGSCQNTQARFAEALDDILDGPFPRTLPTLSVLDSYSDLPQEISDAETTGATARSLQLAEHARGN